MTDNITVSRELLRQAIEALDEADNVLTSSMFAEAATALRAALEHPAPVQEPSAVFYRCNHCGHGYEDQPPSSCDCASGYGFERVEYFTAQPRKAVKLSDSEILAALEVEHVSSAQNRELFLSDARIIEATVWAKLGVKE